MSNVPSLDSHWLSRMLRLYPHSICHADSLFSWIQCHHIGIVFVFIYQLVSFGKFMITLEQVSLASILCQFKLNYLKEQGKHLQWFNFWLVMFWRHEDVCFVFLYLCLPSKPGLRLLLVGVYPKWMRSIFWNMLFNVILVDDMN